MENKILKNEREAVFIHNSNSNSERPPAMTCGRTVNSNLCSNALLNDPLPPIALLETFNLPPRLILRVCPYLPPENSRNPKTLKNYLLDEYGVGMQHTVLGTGHKGRHLAS